MSTKIDNQLLDEVADLVAERIGLHFSPERRGDLERGLSAAASDFDFDNVESCLHWLSSSPLTKNQIEVLASHLTVGETYFFREKKSLEIVEQSILPTLIKSRGNDRRLRIWSAGCCTGEEPYTIAIILAGMIPDLERWNITLLATDINPRFLSKASAGVYSDWSFRDTPEWIRSKYFHKARGGKFELIPQVKNLVTFAYLNLAEDAFPSLTNNTNAMDIIFCRNVLMYLAPRHVRTIARNFYRCLIESGWLVVSPSDASQELSLQLAIVHRPGAILYRKGTPSVEEDLVLPVAEPAESPISWAASVANLTEPETPPCVPPEELEQPFAAGEPTGTPCAAAVPDEALTLYEQGHYAAAADRLAAQLSTNPEDAEAMTLLARVHANQGNLAEALVWCDKAIARQKMNPGVHYLRATILQEQGALDEAGRSLQRILYLDPNFALARFTLGTIALQLGRLEASDKHFENARALLATYPPEEILPESGGITAGRLTEIILRTTARKVLQ
ncbi:MAG: CheR family methyltransferase [Candidatus Sulfotelmatobacter sp.]